MGDESVRDMLSGLASPEPSAAWNEFLQRYSTTILNVVRRFESDRGRAEECFQRVCEALSDQNFHRLLSYRHDSNARFRTWLATVTANLCIDLRRRKKGRFRPLRAVARLPEREQLIYRCLYVRGMSRLECLRFLAPRFPELTEHEIADVNARLFSLLTPRQRWQLGARATSSGPGADAMALELDDAALQLEDPGPGPEQLAQSLQDCDRLAAAMGRLPARERLLLRLRYEQNLTLAEVARLTGLHDPFRANRQIQAALVALAGLINHPPAEDDRKSP